MILLNRYKIASSDQSADLSIFWDSRVDKHLSVDLPEGVVNGKAKDISKNNVERVHWEVFGYGLQVNPYTHRGRAWAKGTANGTQDGVIVNLPIDSVPPELIFQQEVNNVLPNGMRRDYCIPVVNGSLLDIVHVRHRSYEGRIGPPVPRSGQLAELRDVFTDEEVRLVSSFCQQIKLGFGELDVVRDYDNQRIYILDVNPMTGIGRRPNEMENDSDYWLYLAELANSIHKRFFLERDFHRLPSDQVRIV